MNPIKNPFSPGAGSKPPELVGREPVIEAARVLLARIQAGRSEKSIMLTGLRGVGKTVLLNEMQHMAEEAGYQTVYLEAHEDKSLAAMLAPPLRQLLYRLDRMEGAKEKIRRGFAVMRSFIGGLQLTIEEIKFGLDIEPERGTADSGDIEYDLPDLLVAIAEAARDRGTAVALLIDELQYLKGKELSALIMAMHRMQQRQLPMVLVGAGLPLLPRLAGESKSYAERLFAFPVIGPLEHDDARRAIRGPVISEGEAIAADAIEEILRVTHRYPYFLQEWGYQSWNLADASPIELTDVKRATETSVGRLDENFFRVRFDRLAEGEKAMLRAAAELGDGPYRTGDIAEAMGLKVSSLGPRRANLIQKGMVYSPAHGELAFTVPLFDKFLLRVMPEVS